MDDYFKPFKKCTKWFCKYKKEVEPFPHSHIPYSKENKACSECGGKLKHEYCCWGRIFRRKAISIYDQFKCVQCEVRNIISSELTMKEKSEVSPLDSLTKEIKDTCGKLLELLKNENFEEAADNDVWGKVPIYNQLHRIEKIIHALIDKDVKQTWEWRLNDYEKLVIIDNNAECSEEDNPFVFRVGDIFGNKKISKDFLIVDKINFNTILLRGANTDVKYELKHMAFAKSFGINECSIETTSHIKKPLHK